MKNARVHIITFSATLVLRCTTLATGVKNSPLSVRFKINDNRKLQDGANPVGNHPSPKSKCVEKSRLNCSCHEKNRGAYKVKLDKTDYQGFEFLPKHFAGCFAH